MFYRKGWDFFHTFVCKIVVVSWTVSYVRLEISPDTLIQWCCILYPLAWLFHEESGEILTLFHDKEHPEILTLFQCEHAEFWTLFHGNQGPQTHLHELHMSVPLIRELLPGISPNFYVICNLGIQCSFDKESG